MGNCVVVPNNNCSLCPSKLSDYEFVVMPGDLKLNTSWVYTPPKKENPVSTVTLTKNTDDSNARRIRRAEVQLKNAKSGSYKTRVEVAAHTYADEPYATLYVQVPSEGDGDEGQYVSVSLNEADLLAVETAVFNARKLVTEATQKKVKRVSETAF